MNYNRKKKCNPLQCLNFEKVHKWSFLRPWKFAIFVTVSLFQCNAMYLKLNAHEFVYFLMTKCGPLQADLSKYWVSARF